MNFTGGWEPDAYRELTQLWATAPNSAAVRAASKAAEKILGADPSGTGWHLAEGLWQLTVPPLVLYYKIDPNRHHVEVTDVFHPT